MLHLLNLVVPRLLFAGSDVLAAFTPDPLCTLASIFIDLHEYGVMIAYIYWGPWLLIKAVQAEEWRKQEAKSAWGVPANEEASGTYKQVASCIIG